MGALTFVNRHNIPVDIDDDWLLVRETNLVERLCQHGAGHPVGHLHKWDDGWMSSHGCDGCCYKAGFWLPLVEQGYMK